MKKISWLLLFIISAMSLFAETKPVVVVVPFDAKGVSRDEVDVISDVFLSEYVSTGVARVVDRNSFDKIAKEHQFQLSEWSDSNKVAEIGKSLNAQMVIVSQVAQFGSQVVFTNRCVDVNTQEIISSAVKRVASVDRLFDECQKMAKELAEKTKQSLMPFPIGSKGSDGGIVFKYEGDYRWEMSKSYNKADYFYSYERCCNPYGYSKLDWYLPSESDMIQIYNNLIKTGIVKDTNSYTSTDRGFSFETGQTRGRGDCDYVIFIRKFDINNANEGYYIDPDYMDGEVISFTRTYTLKYSDIAVDGKTFDRLVYGAIELDYKNIVFTVTVSSDFTYTLEVTYPIYDVTLSGVGVRGTKIVNLDYIHVDNVDTYETEKKTGKGSWFYMRNSSGKIAAYFSRIQIDGCYFGTDYETDKNRLFFRGHCLRLRNKEYVFMQYRDIISRGDWCYYPLIAIDNSK